MSQLTTPSSHKLQPHQIAHMHPCIKFEQLQGLRQSVLAASQTKYTQSQQALPKLILEGKKTGKQTGKPQLQGLACNG